MSLFDNHAGFIGRLSRGNAAITVQEYNEAHVKNGRLMQVSVRPADVAAAGSYYLVFTTPADRAVLVKARNIQTDASAMTVDIFRAPVFSAGTALTVYGTNGNVTYPSTCTVLSAPTVTSVGTQVAATTQILGATAQGQSQRVGFNAAAGFQRFLAPGTTYLLRCTNNGSFTARLAVDLTWFEGPTSEYPSI